VAAADAPTFVIVTPSFQAGRFLDATIASVVSQAGPFRLRYHVQDGASSDDTAVRLARWKERLDSALFPPACQALEFSYSIAPDKGMYDAIQSGFARCGLGQGVYMTWINADDLLMPGSLACAARLFHDFPEVELLGGIPTQIDEEGILNRIHGAQIYPRETLAAGLHDGRHLPFVMQEGTFWKCDLWLKTGGVRTDLRLAGDFDLWRRFAAETSYFSVDTILAAHRRHSGQLTQDHAAYFAEVDAIVEADLERRDLEWERYTAWRERSSGDREQRYVGQWISWETGRWEIKERALPNLPKTTIYVSASGAHRSVPARFISGFLPEGDTLGRRWLHDGVGILQFQALAAGPHRVRIRLRSFSDHVIITMKHGSHEMFRGAIPVTLHDRDCEISADADFATGVNTIALYLDPPQAAQRPDFLVLTGEATPAA
jgi:hypothetical protein